MSCCGPRQNRQSVPDVQRATSLVLDNEAVQALIALAHPKHRRVLAHLEAVVARRKQGSTSSVVWVPTSVRVEAGWDRTAATAAVVNRFRILDHDLEATRANRAVAIRLHTGASVVDAHVGVAVQDAAVLGHVIVLTSDPADIAAASQPAQPTIDRV